jgi:ornithine cyclodeaminase
MSEAPLIWITEGEVVELVDLEEAIEALERGLAMEGAGQAKNVAKALGTWGDGSSMHSLGSMFPETGFAGFKNWVNTKRGATAIFSLFNANNGALLAMIEAGALGQLRTSAIAGVATRWLAREEAGDMALIGTGHQSMTQIASVAAVRTLRRLRVFSPTADKRHDFVARAQALFAFPVEEATDLAAAVDGADIVTLVTRAKEPFLSAKHLARGTHLNAVGAILPANAEFTDDVFSRASSIAVDHLPNVQQASREFIEHYGKPGDAWAPVKLLSQVIAGGAKRPTDADVTIFKAMGMGISDLSLAVRVYERALARKIGKEIAEPRRAVPRWRSARRPNAA